MDHIRIVLMDMPRMLKGIVRDAIDAHDDLRIVGEVRPDADPVAEVTARRADFLIGSFDDGDARHDAERILRAAPRVKVLSLEMGGRVASLFELRPQREPLGEVSPQSLIEAIRAAAFTGLAAPEAVNG